MPRRSYEDDDDYEFDRPRVARGRRRSGGGVAVSGPVVGLVVTLGTVGLLFLLAFLVPPVGGLLVLLGVVLLIVGNLWFYGVALSDGVGQLLLCLFVPFYALFYLVSNFDQTKWPFGVCVLGAIIAVGGTVAAERPRGGADVADRRDDERPAPRVDPPRTDPPQVSPPRVNPPPRPKVEPKVEPKKDDGPDLTSPARPFAVDPQAKAAGKTLYLSVLAPFAYQTGPWKLGIGAKGEDGKTPIVVQKKEFKYGISMHPPQAGACRVSFVPGKEFARFKGSAGIGDGMNPFGTVGFAVYGDGRKLWESLGVPRAGTAVAFEADVAGVEVLTLETRMKDGSNHAAHAVWLDPWLER